MKINYIYIVLAICSLYSCTSEEGTLEPSGVETGYAVPQGSHDYDTDIVNFYEKYGSYLLYDFTEKDAYWTPSKWNNGVPTVNASGATAKMGFIVDMPDQNYIKPQLDLLNTTWFSHYSEEFKKHFLPVKILLCSQVKYCDYDYSSWPFQITASDVSAYYNFDNISVSYAKAAVETMTADEKTAFEKNINRAFVDCMRGQAKLVPTAAFAKSANYSSASTKYTNTELWTIGVLQPYYSASSQNDWEKFVTMMVCYSEEYLNREVSYVDEYDSNETSWEGIFSSQKDKNGLLKTRYNAVRQYYIDIHKMDLQTVGNAIYK